ncbi:hypothetical protein VPH35_121884 [Triticum aestivum]|uniref:fibronectin-binding protein A isoform X2 n=1 Tax=Triticum aestivum TaxID=4565 RepID=UPI001D026D83|nr:fibronectin-binding protein A-like isoform X2 [Triticum aestivum]
MLPIIYMDHLDVPRGCLVDHTINYSLPRACFVHERDFYAVVAVDTLDDGFGKRPFRTNTPYAVVEFMSYIDHHRQGAASEHVTEELPEISNQGGAVGGATHTPDVPESSHMQENVHVGADAGSQSPPHAGTGGTNGSAEHVHEPPPSNTESGDDVCGSLEEWLHALPIIEELELPPQMQVIFNKHKELHARELNVAFSSFGRILQGMYCKRMGLILSEAHKAECSIHGQRAEGEGITFSVPGGSSAAGMSDRTATEPFAQQPKHPEQPNIHPVIVPSPQQPKQPATATVPSPQQPKQPATATVPSPQQPKQPATATVPSPQQPKQPATATLPSPQQPKQPAVEVGQNNDNDQSNGRGEDSGSKEFPQVRTSPVKTSVADLDSLSIRTRSPLFGESPATSAGPVYDVTPIATRPPISTGPAEAGVAETREEVVIEVSSGGKRDAKKPTLKRVAKLPENAPKLKRMKKIKVNASDDAIYK